MRSIALVVMLAAAAWPLATAEEAAPAQAPTASAMGGACRANATLQPLVGSPGPCLEARLDAFLHDATCAATRCYLNATLRASARPLAEPAFVEARAGPRGGEERALCAASGADLAISCEGLVTHTLTIDDGECVAKRWRAAASDSRARRDAVLDALACRRGDGELLAHVLPQEAPDARSPRCETAGLVLAQARCETWLHARPRVEACGPTGCSLFLALSAEGRGVVHPASARQVEARVAGDAVCAAVGAAPEVSCAAGDARPVPVVAGACGSLPIEARFAEAGVVVARAAATVEVCRDAQGAATARVVAG